MNTVPTVSATRQRYIAVNGMWPENLPPLTAPEAVKAFRSLYRQRFEKRWLKPVEAVKGKHRRTWTHAGKMIVSPDQGWHDFIHDLSHWMHRRQYPGQNPHKGSSHPAVERDLIERVVNAGWLEGRLKPKQKLVKPPVPKPEVPADEKNRLRRIRVWEKKQKAARKRLKLINQTLRKLRK